MKLNSREWPVWYLRDVLRSGAGFIDQGVSDDQLVRWWHGLHVAAPEKEIVRT